MKTISLFLLTLFVAALAVPEVQAGDIQVNWTFPVKNEDGTNIPASGVGAITHSRVEWGSCNGANFGTKISEALVAAPALTYTVTNLAPGTYCLRAYVRTSGSCPASPCESVATNVVSRTLVQPKPLPHATFAAEVLVAYTVVKQRDSFLLVRVGTIPAGTACSTTQYINGHQVVPRSAVTFDGTVRPEVVVAKCSGA